MNKKQKKMLIRIAITAVMLIALAFLPLTGIWRLLAYVAAYLVIGYDILRKAGIGIIHGRAFDECFLMAIATLGAFFLAVWTKSGDYVEGISVMLFYQIGELFQSYAVGKSRRNISALMDIRPDYANIEKDGKLEQVDPDEVTVGSIIVVQPGEKVPLDGVVVSGNSTLNTSALTGESIPIAAQVVGLADAYDTLTGMHGRVEAVSHEEVIHRLLNDERGSFNPVLLSCLFDLQSRIPDELETALLTPPQENLTCL